MSSYVLYSNIESRDTILEIWGGSTKHPDCKFHFSNFHLSEWYEPEMQTLPWVLECASKLNSPYHSYELASWICEIYENKMKN